MLLIATGSYRAEDFVAAAGRLEVEVVVGSDHEASLAGLAPGRFLELDFSAPWKSANRIAAFARRRPLRTILAVEDEGVLTAAAASRLLSLPHNPVEAVVAARRKDHTRRRLRAASLLCPDFDVFSVVDDPARLASRVRYPCVLKPLALSASRGVIRADGPDEFVAAFERIGRILARPDARAREPRAAGGILVEDYLPGREVALEGLLDAGRLRPLAFLDKPEPMEGPTFEETLLITPSRLDSRVQEDVIEAAARAARALGLRSGAVHAELRVNQRGVWLLEMAPRSIGGLCSRLLRFRSGASLEQVILRQALGEDPGDLRLVKGAAGVMMLPIPRSGILREVRGVEEAGRVEGIRDVVISIPVGRTVVALPEGHAYLGFLFARAATPRAVEAALRHAHACLTFAIEAPGDRRPARVPARKRPPPAVRRSAPPQPARTNRCSTAATSDMTSAPSTAEPNPASPNPGVSQAAR